MGANDLVASMVSSLAWPTVALIAIVILRSPLRGLLGRLQSYEGAGQKITFGEQLRRVESSADTIASGSAGVDEKLAGGAEHDTATASNGSQRRLRVSEPGGYALSGAEPERIAAMASASGSGAVVMAWREVERALSELYDLALKYNLVNPVAGGSSGSVTVRGGVEQVVSRLERAGLLPDPLPGVLSGLRRLRNSAVHGVDEISEGEAVGYGDVARIAIEGIARQASSLKSKFESE